MRVMPGYSRVLGFRVCRVHVYAKAIAHKVMIEGVFEWRPSLITPNSIASSSASATPCSALLPQSHPALILGAKGKVKVPSGRGHAPTATDCWGPSQFFPNSQ